MSGSWYGNANSSNSHTLLTGLGFARNCCILDGTTEHQASEQWAGVWNSRVYLLYNLQAFVVCKSYFSTFYWELRIYASLFLGIGL